MSDLRIGLVAEGKTDGIVIEAALKAMLDRPFTLTPLQPEPDLPFGGAGALGGGWGGVYKWCRQHVSMISTDGKNASLSGYDLIIVHVDADVAGRTYQSANIEDAPDDLPCQHPCPPALDSVEALRTVVMGWLDLNSLPALPDGWGLCIPSKCIEAWVVEAIYGEINPGNIMENLECKLDLENWLSQRRPSQGRMIRRGKKVTSAYRAFAGQITSRWFAFSICTQAARFTQEVRGVLADRPN